MWDAADERKGNANVADIRSLKLVRYDEVPFRGGVIPSILGERNGRQIIAVHIKATCERLGIDYPTQYSKIKDHPVWSKGIGLSPIPSVGGSQNTTVLELRYWLLWLANIDPRRVNPELVNTLISYQEEAAEVLEAHFLGKGNMINEAALFQAMMPAITALAQQIALAAIDGISQAQAAMAAEVAKTRGRLGTLERTAKHLGRRPLQIAFPMDETDELVPTQMILLRDQRAARGWTQAQAAVFLGISRSYYSQVEEGLVEAPGWLKRRIAALFGGR